MKRLNHIICLMAISASLVSCSSARKTASSQDKNEFPPVCTDGRVAIAAHRGFWNCEEGGFSQNSIASLKAAQNHGFWGSEFDVHITSDDVVIVNHDGTIDGKKIGDNPFSAFDSHRLANGEKVSTLDEYLAQGEKSKKTMLVCELKIQKNQQREDIMIDKTIELLKKHGLYSPDRVMFISFSHHICQRLAAEAPAFVNQYLNGDIAPSQLAKEGINGIDYQTTILKLHSNWPKECAELGMSSNAWTVNSEKDMRKMIEIGVGCITTNFPLLTRSILGEKELTIK